MPWIKSLLIIFPEFGKRARRFGLICGNTRKKRLFVGVLGGETT
jgi:hypothetical protein